MATTTTTTTTTTAPKTPYSWTEPADEKLRWSDHFSSLLFGGSWQDTLLELVLLCIPLALWAALGSAADVPGSMGILELAAYFWASAVYVACLRACATIFGASTTLSASGRGVNLGTGYDVSTTRISKGFGLLSLIIARNRPRSTSSRPSR